MEKFSQFRDKGSGIAPFIPISTARPLPLRLAHALLFSLRLPPFVVLLLAVSLLSLLRVPLPPFLRKVLLWSLMGVPGIWWVDLQLDGVKRGSLSSQPRDRFPHPGSVVAANFTSPVDAVYLAAVFDPVFVVGYPGSRGVRRVGLLGAAIAALAPVRLGPPPNVRLTDLAAIRAKYPGRVLCVFPECGTTNGKAILPLSPSLLVLPPDVHVFPVSIRYAPADITTPVPGRWARFLWDLLSRPTTCIRVRVAQSVVNDSGSHAAAGVPGPNGVGRGASTGIENGKSGAAAVRDRQPESLAPEEQRVLDRVAEALARLCRNRRVGLTLRDKAAFVDAWNGKKR